jgi:signal transduction histidine kinase
MELTGADIEARRRRLFASAFLLLSAFACFAVALSFFGPDVSAFLSSVPAVARIGILLLAFAFMALVWERERHLERVSANLQRQQVLIASFENRLRTIEGLVRVGEVPVVESSVHDLMRVVLDAAVDLAGVGGGSIELIGAPGEQRAAVQVGAEQSAERKLKLPLTAEGETIGVLTLELPEGTVALDDVALGALEQFTEQAGSALSRARRASTDFPTGAYLQAANTVKSRFLATVSHELRTPLTSIVGYATTLDSHWERLPEIKKREFVRALQKEANRLSRLVERILEAASVEMEEVAIQPVIHDVRSSVTNALRPFVEGDGERLIVEAPDTPLEAEVDPFVIHEVVSNIVDNALRYTKGTVFVSLDGTRHAVRIAVRDEGPGMEPTKLELMTKGLYSIEESVTSGTGLGMHVVQALLRHHGGEMTIASDPRGTKIRVTLLGGAARLRAKRRGSHGGTSGGATARDIVL